MRVTEKILNDSLRRSVMDNRERLFNVQTRISANRKNLTLSDDPRAAEKAAQLKANRAELEQFRRNISFGKSTLELSVDALRGVEEQLSRARELAVQFSSGEYTAEDRGLAAAEMGEIYRQVLAYANTRNGSDYVFSGFGSNTPAYSADGVWQGDAGSRQIRIGQVERIAVNAVGADVFGSSTAAGGVPAGGVMRDLRELRTALENNDPAGVRNSIDTMDAGIQSVVSGQATLGTRLKRMEVTESSIGDLVMTIAEQLSGIEDLDIAEMAMELKKQETAFQAAVEVAGRISSMTLLDAVKR